MALRNWLSSLLGVSAYTPMPSGSVSLDDPEVERARESYGGLLSPLTVTRTRWYLADLEAAQHAADVGDISQAAQLSKAMRRDGVFSGLMSTRTGGLVRLPKRFTGRPDIVMALDGRAGARKVFDEMFPAQELALLARDGIELGVGVAELVPVEGRDFPVMIRLDPEWLRYRWNENRWYYMSVAGPIPITPGDGRWILHIPGGRVAPWANGLWPSLGRAYINKEHAVLHRANWEAKLANPARVAVAPQGATEEQRQAWFKRVMAWGVNTVFGMTPGYDVKLLESNGRGYESFNETVDRSEREYAIAIAGQIVTVEGGTGFSNQDVHKSIRADIIQMDADGLAYTINTQGIPPFVVQRWGEGALEDSALVEWDVTEPHNMSSEAATLVQVAAAITGLRAALQPYGRDLDVTSIASRFGIPIAGDIDGDGVPDAEQTPDAPANELEAA